jgi:hypothetical protein
MDQTRTQSSVMTDTNDGEIDQAISEFAMALTEADVFQAFEVAAQNLRQDQEAQGAIRAFQEKQNSLQMMLMLNAVPRKISRSWSDCGTHLSATLPSPLTWRPRKTLPPPARR